MDLGNAESMLYSSGVFTLNNAMTMFCDVCISNTKQHASTVLRSPFNTNILLMQQQRIPYSVQSRFNHRPINIYPDAIPPIHAVSSHVATDKDPSKFRSIFSNNLQPIATSRKIARGTLLVDIGCSSERAPPSVSYYQRN